MAELIIDTGLREFDVNGKCKFRFSPTDFIFIERVYKAFESLDSINTKAGEELQGITDNVEFFEKVRGYDSEMRAVIDGITGIEDFCGKAFDGVGLFSFGDGLPIWANFMLAIIDQLDEGFNSAKALENPRLQKYIKKYKK